MLCVFVVCVCCVVCLLGGWVKDVFVGFVCWVCLFVGFVGCGILTNIPLTLVR